ncbi:DUF7147 family protein [Bacillus sp. FJAT-45350]|uniref:DUF7147 family protein n=1 Tax=Bacillus sp. FJAT-45350 TaxID=2011014 RepID=UPI000BB826EB|nr:methylthioribose kinase [Bacillus sp. FJAT-45350]
MIQRFIELGQGYSDIYEIVELAKTNKNRLLHLMRFDTIINDRQMSSLVIILKPAGDGNFMPLYICREGIPNPEWKANKRYDLFSEMATSLNKKVIPLDLKSSDTFGETDLYYQYVIGVLRTNNYIPPLS